MKRYRSGPVEEALRSKDTGCSAEEYRYEMTGDEAKTWHWRLQTTHP